MTQTPFEIDAAGDDRAARLAVSGELDLATVPRVEQAVDAALAQDARTLIIDLSGLGFIDSSGLRLLIVLHQRATSEGWTLSLIRPPQRAMTVFQVSGLEENLPFAEKSSLA
jgi:anti-sigma B factor antagonist